MRSDKAGGWLATLIGFSAIVLWSFLALLTIKAAPVPPFLLNSICFAIGGGVGLIWAPASGQFYKLRQVPVQAYLFGTMGLFLYHFLYFTAFRLSPTAQTGLVAYLWPLLIVLFSGLLPHERLCKGHFVGAVLAFGGVWVMAWSQMAQGAFDPLAMALALACAFIWAGYSVISRLMGQVPTIAVTVYCLATALLSALAHIWWEQTIWPDHPSGWAALLALGLGPVGIAFFTWDHGMKKGNIQFLGVASYLAPLLSTLILIVAGISPFSPQLIIAAVMITVGAALAALTGAQKDRIKNQG